MEKRRAISPALVQPFMRGIMEAPFPAPGRTITVKNFLPGSGTEVRCRRGKKKAVPAETNKSAAVWRPVDATDRVGSRPAGDRAVQAVRLPAGTRRL